MRSRRPLQFMPALIVIAAAACFGSICFDALMIYIRTDENELRRQRERQSIVSDEPMPNVKSADAPEPIPAPQDETQYRPLEPIEAW